MYVKVKIVNIHIYTSYYGEQYNKQFIGKATIYFEMSIN